MVRASKVRSGGGTSTRGGRGFGGGRGVFFLATRALPTLLLPLTVGAFQWTFRGTGGPLVLVALALGVTISVAVRNGLLATLTTALSAGLLLSAAYVQELQAVDKGPSFPGQTVLPQRIPLALEQTNKEAIVPVIPQVAETSLGTTVTVDLAPVQMETMSVVLPCAFEGQYAGRTVEALRRHTKRSRLQEIIVVDDGSQPPLSLEFPQTLLRGSAEAPVRMLRHEKTRGLIAAKKTGGDAATGDVIVFFDCHINPRPGWEEAFLRQMKRAGDHRTVVVPTITALDPDTWRENEYGSQSKACYLLWNGDFTWLGMPGRDVPLMSGGLLALSRRWWQETEGYDPHMVAWGGENIDQSLRAWLCGGRIEVAEGAFVAHMWREASNPKTQLKYPIPTEDVMRNKARAITAWLDEFKEKTLSFPEYEMFVSGEKQLGDMSNFDRLRKKLHCAPFSSYIHRFSYVYVDTGLIPEEVFQLKEESTGRCLERAPRENPLHTVVLAPCAGTAGGESGSGGIPELQLWHGANRDHSRPNGPCCSGLANWNFIQCLDGQTIGQALHTFECEIQGHSQGQFFKLETASVLDAAGQVTWQSGQGCLAPLPANQRPHNPAEAALEACSTQVEPLAAEGSFRLRATGPGGHSGGPCATAVEIGGDETRFKLEFLACQEGDGQQVFQTKPMLDGLQVKVGESGLCLDAAGGGQLLVYPCYDEDKANQNQVWQLRGGGKLVWEGMAGSALKAFCVQEQQTPEGDSALGMRPVPVGRPLTLRTCSSKVGQRIRRHEVKDDSFLLRDADAGNCLGTVTSAGSNALERALRLGECHDRQRWRELKERDQMQHLATNLCIDAGAGDETTPILYPCHEPKAQRKQRFRVLEAGGVQLRSGWEDNGRKRYFEKCLDHAPEPLLEVTLQKCDDVRQRGVRWKKVGAHQPPETVLWHKAVTPPPGDPGLGGGAAPP